MFVSDRLIQLGRWRLGERNENRDHLCLTHQDHVSVQIWRSDNTLHPGPVVRGNERQTQYNRPHWDLWTHGASFAHEGVKGGDRFIQLGDHRIGVSQNSLCITHRNGKTLQMFNRDGTASRIDVNDARGHEDRNLWSLPLGTMTDVLFGGDFIIIGEYCIGVINEIQLSIGHIDGNTCAVYNSNGSINYNGRSAQSLSADTNPWRLVRSNLFRRWVEPVQTSGSVEDAIATAPTTIVLTRPKSAGDLRGRCSNLHHLHIRRLEAYDISGARVELTHGRASFFDENDNSWNVGCVCCQKRRGSSSEDMFMEFVVPAGVELNRLVIFNRNDGCDIRLLGSYLDIRRGDQILHRWEIAPSVRNGVVHGEARVLRVDTLPSPLPENLRLSYNHDARSMDEFTFELRDVRFS